MFRSKRFALSIMALMIAFVPTVTLAAPDNQANAMTEQPKMQSVTPPNYHPNITPEQQKAAMKQMENSLDDMKKLYMQQLEMMQKAGLPVFPAAPGQEPKAVPTPPNQPNQ